MEETTEGKLFSKFERYEEFLALQHSFLSVNLAVEPNAEEEMHELQLLEKLSLILDEYQEQSYLLDPFLEQLVSPVVECLKRHASVSVVGDVKLASTKRVEHVALFLYNYIKFRGRKTIIRFFPHAISDLSVALDYMLLLSGSSQEPALWPLRYVILLWLSLICMIPFDLAQFDEPGNDGKTAAAIESLAKVFLGTAGLEREGAAMLLSRFYMRKDTRSSFHTFLEWAHISLSDPTDVFSAIGLLQVVCDVVKLGPVEQVQVHVPQILSIGQVIENSPTLISNTMVRKFKLKLVSRVALRIVPPRSRARRKGRSLVDERGSHTHDTASEEGDIDVPEDVDIIFQDLFTRLQDKDTTVRWSAAKGIARISDRLPSDFGDQVMDTITGLFAIHSMAGESLYTMPAIAESTWHGACLACAEMARRGLVGREQLQELIKWLSKALYFDIRKGAHSIGSNVRDAAAYVLWALARTQDAAALAPHADNLARRLVTVALYDREIQIRRAASAAFQEHVGRMALFPHGIDVLRKTDFYSISVRRNAFAVAAPQVAEHAEYRSFLFDHLLNVTLRHWHSPMRQLGAQSLRLICQSDMAVLGPKAEQRAALLLDSVDIADLQGGLLALVELASAYRDLEPRDEYEIRRQETFRYLARVPLDILQSSRNELATSAACQLIANSISSAEIHLEKNSSVPDWRKIVDYGLKHRSTLVQEDAAKAMAAISKLTDCSPTVTRYVIREFRSGSPTLQQSLGRFLGVLDYDAHPHGLSEAIQCLLDCVKLGSPTRMTNVEARRNCYLALPQILATVAPRLTTHLAPPVVCEIFSALNDGLDDYTLDERGDVGSWIRIACIEGLSCFIEILFSCAGSTSNFAEYLSPVKYHCAISGIIKQGVERLDSVRQAAGSRLLHILQLPLPDVDTGDLWSIHGTSLMKELFFSEEEVVGWHDSQWLFPKAVRLLEIAPYRKSVLKGFILSVGSRTDSTQRPAASSMVTYAQSLAVNAPQAAYDLLGLVQDLIDLARSHFTMNSVFVPALQTLNVLLAEDALERLAQDMEGLKRLRALFSMVHKGISRLKNIQRVLESMKLLVNLLPFSELFDACVPYMADLLGHQFPKVRSDTAEYLYLVLQTKDVGRDTDEAEDILLETEWSSADVSVTHEAVGRLVRALLGETYVH